MTLRHVTSDGTPDRPALRDMQRAERYHRRVQRSTTSSGSQRRQLVDYGGANPYEDRADQDEGQDEDIGIGGSGRSLIHSQTSGGDQGKGAEDRRSYQGWKPIRIHVNTDYLDLTVQENPDDVLARQKIAFLRDEVFPEAVERFRDVLRVYPAQRLEIDQEGSCPGYGIAVQYDLVVFAFADCAADADGDGKPDAGRIAVGRSCQGDEYDRPVAGYAGMCLDAVDLATDRGRRIALETVMHEFVHILGFYWEDYVAYRHPRTGRPRTPPEDRREDVPVRATVACADGSKREDIILPGDNTLRAFVNPRTGRTQYEIVTETVTAVARNQFGCAGLTGAWLEDRQVGADDDCFGSHWDFRLFGTEFMTASATETEQYLSPLTVALLEDMGWYRANYNSVHVRLSPFGRLAGCDFVYEDCIVNGRVPSYSMGNFCTSEKLLGCDATHTSVARCSQYKFKSPLPEEFQYFSDPTLGGRNEQMDYCPVYGALEFSFDGANDGLGSGGPESLELDCSDAGLQAAPFAYKVETFGQDGRCFDTNFERPLCLKTSCSRERNAVEVVFGDTIRTCLYDFQTIDIPGLPGYSLTCPRLAQVCPELLCKADCAGRGECVVDREDPHCSCNDPNDPSPYCANSPVASLVPTVSPAPTMPKGGAYGRYGSSSNAGRSGGAASLALSLMLAAVLGLSFMAQVNLTR